MTSDSSAGNSMIAMMGGTTPRSEIEMRRWLDNYVRQAMPSLTPDEHQRAVNEYAAALSAEDNKGMMPEGCMIPLAFVAMFLTLAGAMGLLLVLMAGEVALQAAFWRTEVGQAISGTVVLMSLLGGLLAWFRAQTGIGGQIIRVLLGTALLGSGGLLGLQALALEPDTLGLTSDPGGSSEGLMAAFFGVSIATGLLMWLRRRVMGAIWSVLLLVLIVGLVALAQQSGMIDLREFDFSTLTGLGQDAADGFR